MHPLIRVSSQGGKERFIQPTLSRNLAADFRIRVSREHAQNFERHCFVAYDPDFKVRVMGDDIMPNLIVRRSFSRRTELLGWVGAQAKPNKSSCVTNHKTVIAHGMTRSKMAFRSQIWSRRSVLAGTTLSLLPLTQITHAKQRGKAVTETEIPTYDTNGIDLNSLTMSWPEKHPMPKLIVEIAMLIAPWPWGLLSYFYISGARFNDHVVENGADLHNDFGIFMKIANGSEYALWFHEGSVPGAEPVVKIDDEGQHNIIAPTLHAFFTEWASGRGISMLEPFDYEATPELLAARHAKGKEILSLIAASPPLDTPMPAPDFYDYIEKYGAAARAANAANPTLQAIAKLLDAHIPRGKEEWEAEVYTLTAIGNNIKIETRYDAPLPERDALIPLLKQAREERVKGTTAPFGPWTSAVMRLYPNGLVQINASWD
jgi:hypothetical protein